MAHLNSSPLLPQMRLNPAKIRRPSRSSSRSPERKSQFSYHVLDPLLSNLSPDSTLEALTSVDAVPRNEKTAQDLLTRSISKVSTDERALGIRAAVAAKKLKEWYREVLGWEWPRKADAQLGKGFIPPTRTTQDVRPTSTIEEEEYYGSLPVEAVRRYETRIEEIRDGMDSLDVEELKEHVLNAHVPSRSRPSSSASTISVGPPSFSYVQLSDFTAIVTATILRLLPTLSRLNFLLTTWDVRLIVLRQIPGLLSQLEKTRVTMDSSMAALKVAHSPNEAGSFFSRDAFHAKRAELEALVVSAGRRMDNILDALEGREDSLPEAWIDDLEAMETEFATWTVEAEKRAVMNELMHLNKPKPEPTVPKSGVHAPEPQAPVQDVSKTSVNQSTAIVTSEKPADASIDAQAVSSDRKLVEISANIPGSTPNVISSTENLPAKPTDTARDPISRSLADSVQSETPTQRVDARPRISNIGLDQPRDIDASRFPREPMDDHLSDISEEMSTDSEVSPTGKNDLTGPSVGVQEQLRTNCDMEPPLQESSQGLTDPPATGLGFEKELEPHLDNSSLGTYADNAELSDDESTSASHSHVQGDDQAEKSPRLDGSGIETQPLSGIRVENTFGDRDTSSSEHRSSSPTLALENVAEIEPESVPQQHSIAPEDNRAAIVNSDRDTPTPEDVSTPVVKPADEVKLEDVPIEKLSDVATSKKHEGSDKYGIPKESTILTDPSDPLVHDVFMGPSQLQGPASLDQTDTDTPRKARLSESPTISSPHGVPFSSLFSKPRDRYGDDARNQAHLGSGNTTPDGDHTDVDEESSPKLGLESPIRMSKLRPKPLNVAKGQSKSHRRHPSDVSGADSPISDYPSLLSSPETREAYTSASPTTPLVTETPTPPRNNHLTTDHARSNSQATLRQEHLLNFDRHRGPNRAEFKHCRTASLPLQRFINEDVNQDYDDDFVDMESLERSPSPSPEQLPNGGIHSLRKRPAPVNRRGAPATRHSTSGAPGFSISETGAKSARAKRLGSRETSESPNLPQRMQKPSSSKAPSVPIRSSKRSSRPQNDAFDEPSTADSANAPTSSSLSRPASPFSKTTGDELEDKINSILNALPARIHLTHAPTDGPAVNSSAPSQRNERLGSVSPRWPSSRSSTPTPSLYLTPAYNRTRRPRSHASEESSVRVYHLHRGKTAPPTKLFVRTVGEGGERVMVRVGGGWADLGEYLREYAIHHGSRRVSEQPKVEVQEIPSHSSPSHSSPGSTLTQPSNNGRTTPSRPGSSLSSRSPSALAVRKTRQPAAPVDELGDLPTVDSQAIGDRASPMSAVSSRNRRLSVSSNNSVSVASTADSPFAGSSHSTTVTPLGLAGPKPRSRRMSMSPESEAWVEDVLGQARKNASLKLPKPGAVRTGRESSLSKRPSEPKLRSVSDIGTAGLNKRVLLRGLDRRRESSQGL
ncbi:GAS2 domain protein [Paecilomyces variotii No. 5]|uniref:GAS2 domain protein n=1 Tax=Byssochlamys spectabilis (strain No. 5 / NBRC 109023) TaxID=1356009 RepID=V5FIL9_BYSSN|nr:GAS2 domain protein [Paecilomyces variotii No. 5]